MENFYHLPDHYPDDIKDLIEWGRKKGYDSLELYQDLKCIMGLDHDEEFRTIMNAEKKAVEDFDAIWSKIL